jgi:hypothetical protein
MATNISSINIKPIKGNSERHNFDQHRGNLDYIFHERTELNQHWELNTGIKLSDYQADLVKLVKEKTGRAMQKKATPIREGVINMSERTTLEDLKQVSDTLYQEFGIKPIQIHIHEDEGYHNKVTGDISLNRHAHILFEWIDRDTGKSIKLNQIDMRRMQDIVAKELKMERGDKIQYEKELPNGRLKKSPGSRKHLTPEEFKNRKDKLAFDLTKDKIIEYGRDWKFKKVVDSDKTVAKVSLILKTFEGVQKTILDKDLVIQSKESEEAVNKLKIDSLTKEITSLKKDLSTQTTLVNKIWGVLSEKEKGLINSRLEKQKTVKLNRNITTNKGYSST